MVGGASVTGADLPVGYRKPRPPLPARLPFRQMLTPKNLVFSGVNNETNLPNLDDTFAAIFF